MSDWEDFGDEFQYQSVADLRRKAEAAAKKLGKKGRSLSPVRSEARSIARSFWGKAWCRNLESYSDYEHRLPRGRSYLRNGTVIDLQIARGEVNALVQGSELYEVSIHVKPIDPDDWTQLKTQCAGRVGSLLDLLQGKLSGPVMEVIIQPENGLFPKPREIRTACTCPDYADVCKHVAAALYGVGVRLDEAPELLFLLRGANHRELTEEITQHVAAVVDAPSAALAPTLDGTSLAEVFGIEIDAGEPVAPPAVSPSAKRPSNPKTKPQADAKIRAKGKAKPAAAKKTRKG